MWEGKGTGSIDYSDAQNEGDIVKPGLDTDIFDSNDVRCSDVYRYFIISRC